MVGVVIAHEFGRTDETDGFFAAYGVFIVLALAAQSIRISVLPSLARASDERRLASELGAFAVAIAAVAIPLVVVAEVAAVPIAGLLTGSGSMTAQDAAAYSLRWMVPAAVGAPLRRHRRERPRRARRLRDRRARLCARQHAPRSS